MKEINLLRSLPKTKRKVQQRAHAKTDEHVRIAREYGEEYFDGDRSFGYGGYVYDGRWKSVARDIIQYYSLKPGDKVLDIGCAKGFLIKDLLEELPNLEVYGTDISEYALMSCEDAAIGRIHLHDLNEPLPFPNDSFDAVLCINTLHNLKKPSVINAIQEMERITKDHKIFIQVDSYRNNVEKVIFEDWVLTAFTYDYPEGWLEIFKSAGFNGDYYWTLIMGDSEDN